MTQICPLRWGLLVAIVALNVYVIDARCPNGWITAGSGNTMTCYRLYSGQRKNFNQAHNFCRGQGGYIAKDLTAAIHNKIKRYIINAAKSSSHATSFWLGLTDLNKNGGPWTWVGGPVLGAFKYFVSTPRNTRNKQDCIYVSTSEPQVKWHVTNNCGANRAVICQRDFNTVVATTKRPPRVNCPRGWTANQGLKTCVRLYTQPKTWPDARDACQSQGGDLVIIKNGQTNSWVNGLVARQKGVYWIGLHDRQKENQFEWLDSDLKATFTYWNNNEPNNYRGNENCVALLGTRNNKWNDASCQVKYRYICQHAPVGTPVGATSPATPASRNCGAGWEDVPNTDICYQFSTERLSWLDARAQCQQGGGDLATIANVLEAFYLSGRSMALDSDFYWIGANDRATEQGWQWVDRSPFAFLNWDVRQPNNAHNSDCVAMVKKSGAWDDFPCQSRYGYICEKKGRVTKPTPKPTTSPARLPTNQKWGCPRGWADFRGSCYQVLRSTGGIDWATAGHVCSTRLSHLVSITDDAENKFVYSLIPRNFSGYVWTGLNDLTTENTFVWSDNVPVTYTLWNRREPNNLHEEDCVVMLGNSGKWNDARCSTKVHLIICKQAKSAQPKGGTPEQQGCPTHAIGYEAQCYSFIYSPARTFTDAQAFCKRKNGNLATIDNGLVQAFIGAEMVRMPGTGYWIGLHSSTTGTNDQYAWTSNFTVDFTAWDKTHTGNEKNTCVFMRTARPAGLWENKDCNQKMPFLCETQRKGFTTAVPTTTTTSRLPCPPGWWGWGNLCYKGFVMSLDKMLTWTDARDYCGTLATGGTLATIRSKPFEEYLRTKVLNGASGSFWIGLNDRDSESGYEWLDGFPLKYTHWASGEPNDYMSREDCVQWLLPANTWNDNYCYLAQNFICQIPRGSVVTTPKPTPTPGPQSLQCGNSSWTEYNNNCYFVSAISGDMTTATWFEARLACLDMGADLASISGDDENGYITSVISAHPQNAFWIGLNELDLDTYKWTDLQPLSYVNWAGNEPNDAFGAEKCVEIVSNGYWNDLMCTDQRGFVCKKRPGDYSPVHVTTVAPSGGCPRGFHSLPSLPRCYHVGGTTPDQRKNYDDAIVACSQMVHKATLASVHSSSEEKFIVTLLTGLKTPAWIGLNDRRNRNKFEWVDNLQVDYTHWGWKQPDENINDQGPDARRDCVDMEVGPKYAGNWNDKKCSNKYAYVCESKKGSSLPQEVANTTGCVSGYERFQDSCYKYSSQQYTWNQAESFCQSEGGHLVSLDSRNEEYYIELQTKHTDALQMWVGLSFEVVSQRYAWSNQWPVVYTNWGHGEPDRANNEGCVSHTVDGQWQDVDCRMKLTFVCEISKGIRPRSTPFTPPQCPDTSWSPYGDYCYKLLNKNLKSWPGANFDCSILGAQLVSIHSDAENKFITGLVTRAGVDAWIGLQRGQGFGYAWSDRSPVQYLYWAQGEPSDKDSFMHQDCVKASSQDGTWYDTDCFDSRAYICKLSAPASRTTQTLPNGIVVTVAPDNFYTNYGTVPGGYIVGTPGPGFNPGNPGNNNPGNPGNPGYNPGNPGNPAYNPGNPGNPGYNPGNPGIYNPGNPGNNPGNNNFPGNQGNPGNRPSSNQQTSSKKDSGSSGLSSGAVAGVVLGVMAILAVAGVAGFLGRRYILAQSPGPNVIASQGYDNATYTTTAGGGDKVSLAVSSDA